MLKTKFHKPEFTKNIITTGQENMAIIGESGCGTSQALLPLVRKYFENRSISVFSMTHRFPQNVLNFGELDFRVIIIDEIHMLNRDEESNLLTAMKEKQNTKFIIVAQCFTEEYARVTDKLFVGHCAKSTLNDFYNEAWLPESSQCESIKKYEWLMFNRSSSYLQTYYYKELRSLFSVFFDTMRLI